MILHVYSHDPNKSDARIRAMGGGANLEKLNKSDASNKSDGGENCDFTGMNFSTVRNYTIKK